MNGHELREALINGSPGVFHTHNHDDDIPYARIREIRYRVIKGKIRVFAVIVDRRREDTTYIAPVEYLESLPAEPSEAAPDVPGSSAPVSPVVEFSLTAGGQELCGQIIKKCEEYVACCFDTRLGEDRMIYRYTDLEDVYDTFADFISGWGLAQLTRK